MRLLIILLLLFSTHNGWAVEKENTAYVKDGRIIIETDEGVKSVDFTMERGHRVYKVNKYTVKEEISMVNEALKVYERKSLPVYNKKLWIYEQLNNSNQTYVDFITNKYNEDIQFSSGGEFVYYQEYSPDGKSRVYGVKVGSDEKFFVNTGSDFYIHTCDAPSSSEFLVTTENGVIDGYHVFNLDGSKVQVVNELNDDSSLSSAVCY